MGGCDKERRVQSMSPDSSAACPQAIIIEPQFSHQKSGDVIVPMPWSC